MVPGRKILKDRCNGIVCSKFNHECSDFTENDRQKILDDFYGTEALQLQREYIARFVNKTETKRKISAKEKSRRNFTIHYCLPKEGTEKSVCKRFFLSTLCITERNVRTALQKKKIQVLSKKRREVEGQKVERRKIKKLEMQLKRISTDFQRWSLKIVEPQPLRNTYIRD